MKHLESSDVEQKKRDSDKSSRRFDATDRKRVLSDPDFRVCVSLLLTCMLMQFYMERMEKIPSSYPDLSLII